MKSYSYINWLGLWFADVPHVGTCWTGFEGGVASIRFWQR